ncbi:hypothetical protein ASD40_18720 [Paenibacillus sp. Root444D2]|nr:hypothetical protein ASD40_18720 [Paenibacillus sp. Root444D2]
MIGRSEPNNDRERRAKAQAREQLNNPPSPNVEIVALEDGRVMIRELDESGQLIWETFGFFGGEIEYRKVCVRRDRVQNV